MGAATVIFLSAKDPKRNHFPFSISMLWNNVGASLRARPSLHYALFFRNKLREEGRARRPAPTFLLQQCDQSRKLIVSISKENLAPVSVLRTRFIRHSALSSPRLLIPRSGLA